MQRQTSELSNISISFERSLCLDLSHSHISVAAELRHHRTRLLRVTSSSSETACSPLGEHSCQPVLRIAQATLDWRHGLLPGRPLSRGVDVVREQATGKN